MTDRDRNTEAAAPTRPLAVGPHALLVSQPTLAQLASIAAVIQRRLSAVTPLSLLANDPAFRLLPVAAQVEAAREAAKVQVSGNGRTLDGMAMATQLLEPDVLAFAVWLLARPSHPELRLEDVRPHVTAENAPALALELSEASGMASLTGLFGGDGGPLASGRGSPGSPGSGTSASSSGASSKTASGA
jgi:hypothetical protein